LLAVVAYRAAPVLSAQSGSNDRGKTSHNNRGKGTNNAQPPTMDCGSERVAARRRQDDL
jgi:hypothetical protein